MKKIIIVFIVIILAIAAGAIISNLSPQDLNAKIYLVYKNGKPLGTAFIEVPVEKDLAIPSFFDVFVDINGNGKFTSNELAVNKIAAPSEKDRPNIFPIDAKLAASLKSGRYKIKVLVNGEKILEGLAKTLDWDFGTISDPGLGLIGGSGNVWDLISPPKANAQTKKDRKINIFNKDVPDLGARKGRPNECVPISTANSLLWLAKKHKFEGKMPATANALIDELGTDFGWNKNGVDRSKFLPGKEKITKERKLPLENKKFDNEVVEGESQLWKKIVSELQDGEDVELVIDFKQSAHGPATASHSVTVVGANNADGNQNITVHDVNTPNGNDTYRVDRNGELVGYPFGKAYVAFIISESLIVSTVKPAIPEKQPEQPIQVPTAPAPIQQPTPQPTPPAPAPIQQPTPQPTPQTEPQPPVREQSPGYY